jgi:hypothetical protein
MILGLAKERPPTFMELLAALRKWRIRSSRSELWRFFERHNITFKKSLPAAEQQRADVAQARRRWIKEQGLLDPAHLVSSTRRQSVPTWCGSVGRGSRGARAPCEYR